MASDDQAKNDSNQEAKNEESVIPNVLCLKVFHTNFCEYISLGVKKLKIFRFNTQVRIYYHNSFFLVVTSF